MAYYHVSPENNEAGACVGPERCKWRNSETDVKHYRSLKEARAESERVLAAVNTGHLAGVSSNSANSDLAAYQEQAREVDGELSVIYKQHFKETHWQQRRMLTLRDGVARTLHARGVPVSGKLTNKEIVELARGEASDGYRVSDSLRLLEEGSARIEQLEKRGEELEAIYEKNPWNRAFLVANGNGHVHKTMDCQTCNKGMAPTKFEWVSEMSASDEDEIVAAAGWRACTVCYPSAPVGTKRSLPSTMMTEDEKRKAEEKAKRDEAKQERLRKAAAAAPTADGRSLIVTDHSFRNPQSKELKTERAAVMYWREMNDELAYAGYSEERNNAIRAEMSTVATALAEKRGVTKAEVEAELAKKRR